MEDFFKQSIRKAGAIALDYFNKQNFAISKKSNENDYLTEADTATSEYLVHVIQEAYPDHAILSEELPDIINEGAQYKWVIDPIDGTRNFAQGIPFWCVLVALCKDEETIMAGLYNPISDDLFFAEKGKGAYRNDTQIKVNNKSELKHSAGIFVSAYGGGIYGDKIERYRAAHMRFKLEADSWMHNFGSMLCVAYVASGGFDYALSNTGMEWDFRAPFLILEEAGAVVTDSDGNPWKPGRQDYIAANKYLHPKVLEKFKPVGV